MSFINYTMVNPDFSNLTDVKASFKITPQSKSEYVTEEMYNNVLYKELKNNINNSVIKEINKKAELEVIVPDNYKDDFMNIEKTGPKHCHSILMDNMDWIGCIITNGYMANFMMELSGSKSMVGGSISNEYLYEVGDFNGVPIIVDSNMKFTDTRVILLEKKVDVYIAKPYTNKFVNPMTFSEEITMGSGYFVNPTTLGRVKNVVIVNSKNADEYKPYIRVKKIESLDTNEDVS